MIALSILISAPTAIAMEDSENNLDLEDSMDNETLISFIRAYTPGNTLKDGGRLNFFGSEALYVGNCEEKKKLSKFYPTSFS